MEPLLGHDPARLPEDLPRPVENGAADHLAGRRLPQRALPATSGEPVDLSTLVGRLTPLVLDRVVEHVWYPVFPPDSHPQEVLSWLLSNPR